MNHLSKRVVVPVVLVILMTVVFLAKTSAAPGGLPAEVRALAAMVEELQTVAALQQKQLNELQASNDALVRRLKCVSSFSGDHDVIFEGCNVHVRNGVGQTGTTNSYGNLIIGYNKNEVSTRTGSHNVILGDLHEYTSYGGIVSGTNNTLTSADSTVLSSVESEARNLTGTILGAARGITDTAAVIVGGNRNYAAVGANFGVAIGGNENTISGTHAVAMGGMLNDASGSNAVICGGSENHATGSEAAVLGGSANLSAGLTASISGGAHNTANGRASAVSGGWTNTVNGDYSSILGGNGVVVNAMFGTSP